MSALTGEDGIGLRARCSQDHVMKFSSERLGENLRESVA